MYCRTVNKKTSLMIIMIMLLSILAAAAFIDIGTDDSDATDVDSENYYYNQLTPLAKSIYDGVKTAEIISENYGRNVYLTFTLDVDATIPEADRETTYSAALADVLKIYDLEQVRDIWITKDFTFEISEDKVVFTNSNLYIPMFEDSREDFAESLEEAYRNRNTDSEWIIDTACRYTIVKSAHNYLCKSVRCMEPVEGKMQYNNIYDVFSFPNYASDGGIAKAMKDICDEYGIPCIVVPCTGNNGESDLSYCNYVQMEDGNWYVVSPKWDMPSPSWNPPGTTYLLSGSSALDIISPVSDFTLPTIAENGYSDNRVMIRFVDYDGSYLPESNMYVKGSELNTALTAGYTNDKIGTFTFTGWDKTIPANATEDMTFQAQYVVQFVEYTYIFVDEDGTTIDTAKYHYGDVVVTPEDPVKAPGDGVVYPFLEWQDYDLLAGYDTTAYPSGKTCTAVYKEVKVGTTFTCSHIVYQVNADGTVSIKEFEAKESYYQNIPIRAVCEIDSNKEVSYAVTGFIAGAGLNYDGDNFVLDSSTGSTNPYFSTRNGILYNGDMTIIYSCPRGNGSTYIAPDSVIEVYPYAFAGNSSSDKNEIGYFTFNEGLKKIGDNAFQYCDLTDFIMPSSIEELGDNLFLGAGKKSYFGSSSVSFILYRPTMTDIVNETTFAGISASNVTINTYDKKFSVDGASMVYMANKVGDTVTYGGIIYKINSTDLGLGNRYHAVTAIEYTSDMTDINFGAFVLGWTMYGSGTSDLEYFGEVYVCTKVDLGIFSAPPSLECPTVILYCGLQELPAGFFSFLDKAYFGVDNRFYGSTEITGYSLFYTKTYTLGGICLNGNVLFASSDTMYIDSEVAGYIHGVMDYALKGTNDLQAITFASDFDNLGKGNFDNVTFRNADDTKNISKTPEALAGRSFTRVGDHMVEVPTLQLDYDRVYGSVTKDTWKSSWSLIAVPLGSVVTVDGTTLSITDTNGNLLIHLTAEANAYVPDCEFVGWNLKNGDKITESMTIEAKFKGKPYVYFVSLNPDYGHVNAYDRFITAGSTATVDGNKLTISGTEGVTVTAIAEDGCAFKSWYYTDSSHVKVPLTSSVTITQSMYFIAEFSGPCKVTFDGGFYGLVDTESINVAPGTTFTAKGNTITFSDGKTVTVTAKEAPEHSTVSFKAWSVASGTVSENMIISATFEVDVEKVEVTFKVNDPALGTVNGKSSDSFSAPYGSTYAYSETDAGYVLTFTYADETVFTATYAVVKAPEHFTNRFVAFQPASHGKITIAHDITGVFEQDVETFTVTVKSSDSEIGTVNYAKEIQILKVPYGSTWATDGNVLTLTQTDGDVDTVTAAVEKAPEHHTYAFAGWDKASGKVEGDTVITAQFTDTITKYKVNIHSNNKEYGSFPAEDTEVEYGSTWKYNPETMMVEFDQPCGRIIGIGYVTHADNKHYYYAFKELSQMEGTITGDLDLDATFVRGLQTYLVTIKTNDAETGLIGVWSTLTTNFAYGTVYTINGNSVSFTCEEDHSDDDTLTANVVDPRDPQIINSFIGWNVTSGTIEGDGLVIIANFESKVGTITPDSKGDVSIDSKSADILIDSTALANIKNAGGELTVKLAEGTVSFDSAAVGKIGTAGSIAIGIVTDESIAEKVKGAKVVSVDFGDNHDFKGGKITVTLPYAPAVGENIDDICIGYVNGDKIEQISATYDTAGFVTFSVDHLSDFAVLHNDFFKSRGSSGSGFPVAIVVVAVIVILAGAGAFAFVKFKGMPNLKH